MGMEKDVRLKRWIIDGEVGVEDKTTVPKNDTPSPRSCRRPLVRRST